MVKATILSTSSTDMVTTLAGQKIECWRISQLPRMARQALADNLGIEQSALQKYERRGTVPGRKVVNILVERGICEHADWFTPALPYPDIAMCSLCQRRQCDPVVQGCSAADCPNQERRVA